MSEKPDDLAKMNEEKWEIRFTLASQKLWYFLKYFFFTKDEHDKSVQYKKFPAKAMHRILVRAYMEHNILFIKKSRQIMMTWIFAGILLWDALFHWSRLNFFQSKKQEDADKVLGRSRFSFDALIDMGIPNLPVPKRTGPKTGTTSNIEFPSMGSELLAIPQGEDIVRSHTCSNIFADEINHQPKGEAGYGAAKATIDGGGKWFGAGTANGKNWVHRLMNNIDDHTLETIGGNIVDSRAVVEKPYLADPRLSLEQQRHWIEKKILSLSEKEFYDIPFADLVACVPGMDYWVTHDGFCCMWVHYTADPDKDPVTKKGKEWYDSYRPGWKKDAWEREMEGSVDTFEGRPIIGNWSREVFVKSLQYDPTLPLLIGIDFGAQVCCATFAQLGYVRGTTSKQLRILSEIVLRGISANTPILAKKMHEMTKVMYYSSWESRNIKCFPDPAGHQTRETTSDTAQNNSIKIIENHGFPCYSKRIGIVESTELTKNVFGTIYPQPGKGVPAAVIDPRCTYMIGVCSGGWHYPDKDDGVHSGKPEKDGEWDHGGDVLRHLVANTFSPRDFGTELGPGRPVVKITKNRYTGEVVKRSMVRPRGRHVYS